MPHRRSSTSAPTATPSSSTRRTGARSTALRWEVTLRCPNCEWLHTGVFDQDTVERFDEELDRGTDNLVDDLKRLIRANMEEEIERFAQALGARPHPPRRLLGTGSSPPAITLPPAAGPQGPAVPFGRAATA